MRTEAYSVGFDTRNYHAPIPEGYSPDEILKRREKNIEDNIIRYLGEYRLGVKFDEIHYSIKKPNEGQAYLESPHSDPGPILDIYRKAIAYRQERGLSVKREVAECIGFKKLQDGLADAKTGTMAIWVSPPGRKKDGYGTHSFTFIGQVVEGSGQGRSLRVVPYRNELSIDEHKDYLRQFDENAEDYNSDIDLLLNPTIVEQADSLQTPEDIISFIGEKEKFNIEWREKLAFLDPLIGGFVELVRKRASGEELLEAKYAIENRVLEEKDYILSKERSPQIVFKESAHVIFERYGNAAPPVAGGSCGRSDSGENGIVSNGILLSDKYGERTFNCPDCGELNTRPENQRISNCQHCDSKNVSCCDFDENDSSFAAAA